METLQLENTGQTDDCPHVSERTLCGTGLQLVLCLQNTESGRRNTQTSAQHENLPTVKTSLETGQAVSTAVVVRGGQFCPLARGDTEYTKIQRANLHSKKLDPAKTSRVPWLKTPVLGERGPCHRRFSFIDQARWYYPVTFKNDDSTAETCWISLTDVTIKKINKIKRMMGNELKNK